jgi:Zn-finger nucleic acid-binding protein
MDGAGFSPRDVAKLKVLLEYKVNRSVKPTTHPCPKCKKHLKARNYANIAGFFVEQCPKGCGIWVRDGDLDRIRILRSLGRFEAVKTKKPKTVPTTAAEMPAPRKKAPPKTVKEPLGVGAADRGGEAESTAKRPPAKKKEPKRSIPITKRQPAVSKKVGLLARLLGLFTGRKS